MLTAQRPVPRLPHIFSLARSQRQSKPGYFIQSALKQASQAATGFLVFQVRPDQVDI